MKYKKEFLWLFKSTIKKSDYFLKVICNLVCYA